MEKVADKSGYIQINDKSLSQHKTTSCCCC